MQVSRMMMATWALYVIGICLFPPRAQAANLISVQSENCTLRLEGRILPGDAAKLKSELQISRAQKLCLDSEGGNFNEAIEIAATIHSANTSVATIIEEHAKCYSACALSFLAGRRKHKENWLPDRRLHVSGMLGFHGPYVRPDAPSYDPTLAAQAREAGMRATGKLIAMGNDEFFPHSLLGYALEKGFNEYFMIDTVDAAGAWKIDLVGFKRPRVLTNEMLEMACRNFDRWRTWQMTPISDPNATNLGEITKDERPVNFSEGRRRRFLDRDFGDEAAFLCCVDLVSEARGVSFKVQLVSEKNEMGPATTLQAELKKDPETPVTPFWYVYSPNVQLKSLNERPMRN